MAISKAKRSVHKKQSVQPKTKNPRTPTRSSKKKLAPGQLALLEKNLPHRRFIDFPLANGKTVEKTQLFLASDCNSLTIEFQDKTALSLDLVPGLTINAQFLQHEKDDVHVIAEWPPIRSQQ